MRLLAPAAALVLLLPLGTTPLAAGPRDRMLITPAALHARLGERNLVLLHIGDKAGYDAEHLPGARLLEYRAFSARSADSLSLELPPVARLDSTFAALGISNDSRIVLYFGGDWLSPTTRAWLTLEYLGLGERTAILDGGLPAWKTAGYKVTADVTPPAITGRLRGTPRPAVIATRDQARVATSTPGTRVIDARDPQFYLGFDAGSGSRAGHLPGARSLPFTTVSDSTGRFLSDAALTELFRAAGVARGDRVVVYCHIGQQATAVFFAARLLGYDVRLFDGSFQDWSKHAELAVVVEVPPTAARLIQPGELATRLAAGDVTLVDARSDLNAYLADHLPGASYLHFESLRATAGGVPGDLLPTASYRELWSRLGIRRDRPVVIYGSGEAFNFNATFAAWLLAGFRHPEVYILDGGYARWAADGRERTRHYPEVAMVPYAADAFYPDVIPTEHVTHMFRDPGTVVVDVRPADQYAGTAGAQLRRGHIPGAVHHFWRDDLTSAATPAWKPVAELKAAYEAQGITPDKTVIVYCNTGTEASHAWFALKALLGYPNVQVYVPSWTGWSEQEDLPVETAAGASR